MSWVDSKQSWASVKKRLPGKRVSFTLVELLVVIAIISILSALLLPALKNARDSAKRMAAMSQLRQVGIATLMIANDYNGWIDGGVTHVGDVASDAEWITMLSSNYLGKGGSKLLNTPHPGMDSRDVNWPWGCNVYFGAVNGCTGPYTRHSLNEVKRPSIVFLVSDGWYYGWVGSSDDHDSACTGYNTFPDAAGKTYSRYRKRGLNFFFVDGHCEWLKAKGYVVNFTTAAHDLKSDWCVWGNLHGFSSPYATDWSPLDSWNDPVTILWGQ